MKSLTVIAGVHVLSSHELESVNIIIIITVIAGVQAGG